MLSCEIIIPPVGDIAIMERLRRASGSSSLCCATTARTIIGVDYGTTGTGKAPGKPSIRIYSQC